MTKLSLRISVPLNVGLVTECIRIQSFTLWRILSSYFKCFTKLMSREWKKSDKKFRIFKVMHKTGLSLSWYCDIWQLRKITPRPSWLQTERNSYWWIFHFQIFCRHKKTRIILVLFPVGVQDLFVLIPNTYIVWQCLRFHWDFRSSAVTHIFYYWFPTR